MHRTMPFFTLVFMTALGTVSCGDSGAGDTTPPQTTATPAGGIYDAAQDVTLSCDDGDGSGCAATYYTVDGSIPTTGSTTYTAPVRIAEDTSLQFFSVDVAGNAEAVRTRNYVIDLTPEDTTAPETTATPAGGAYAATQDVVLACDDGEGTGCDATYYTVDGSDPTTASGTYAGPIAITGDTILKFFSEDLAGNAEAVQAEVYVIDADPPVTTAVPAGGTYDASQDVVLTCDDGVGSGCDGTWYTLDGTDPATSSSPYTGPIAITDSSTLKFFSVDLAGNAEDIQEESYVFDYDPPVSQATPPGGSYNDVQNVMLSCDDGAGSGCAGVYYTLDGSDPTTASPFYIDPIPIGIDTTLKFFAADLAGNAEAIHTEDYVIVVANWEPLGPFGGHVRDVAFDPDTPATAYAATHGGVFKTVDAGAHWAAVNHGLSHTNAMVIAVDPLDPDRVIVGTSGGGAFRSLDGGITWAHVDGIPDAYVHTFAFDGVTAGVVYAGGAETLLKSADGGDSWSALTTGSVNASYFGLAAVGDVVYAGSYDDGVFRSTNAGADWTPVNTGLPPGDDVLDLVVDPLDTDIVYLSVRGAAVYKTTDGGASWALATSGLPIVVEDLAMDPANSDTVYAGIQGEGFYKTTDGGASWAPMNAGIPEGEHGTAVALEPGTPTTLFAGTQGFGVYKSTDAAASWAPSSQGIYALAIKGMAFDPTDSDTLWVVTATTGVFKTTDGGATWAPMNSGFSSLQLDSVLVDPTDPDVAFAGGNRGVYKTNNGGLTWYRTGGHPSATVYALAIDPGSSDILYAGSYRGMHKSVDAGESWSEANVGLGNTSVRNIVIVPVNTDVLYAVGNPCEGIYKSTDGAATWTALDTGLADDCRYALVMDPGDANTLYTGLRGVSKTVDAGATWTHSETGLSQSGIIYDLAIVPDSSRIYAGDFYAGVFISDDGGATWSEFNQSLGTRSVNKVLIDPVTPALVYAGTEAGSVWVYR